MTFIHVYVDRSTLYADLAIIERAVSLEAQHKSLFPLETKKEKHARP